MVDSSKVPFLIVKREQDYLKASALNYAKEHNIRNALEKLYENEDKQLYITKDSFRINKFPIILEEKKKTENILVNYDLLQRLTKKLQRQAIFMWPIDRSKFWLSSLFGPRKKANGSWGFHKGLDMAAAKGTIVFAAQSGKVIESGYKKGYGKMVLIQHNHKFKTRYAHLDEILVKLGSYVKKNDIIGKVGCTGNVRKAKRNGDPSHLHFEVYLYDKPVNPFYFLE